MSSTKIRKVKAPVLDATLTWSANTLTVVTTTAHNLVTGDLVDIEVQNSPQELIQVPVTVTNSTTFTVSASPYWTDVSVPTATLNGKVTISFFRTGQTGRFAFTAPRSSGIAAVVQSFVIGTGGASYTLDGSLDGVHWTNIATITHTTTTGDTQSAQVSPAWAYLSINITSIGAATSLTVLYSA
jgi:hypothetical protein